MTEPNLAGFRNAQVRLVEYMGDDITFMFPASAVVYTPGTAIDPQTGRALDPSVQPLAQTAIAPIVTRAMVVRSGLSPSQAGEADKLGVVATGDLWLRIPQGTYDTTILNAAAMSVFGETYLITRFILGGMNSVVDHIVIHGNLADGLDTKSLAGGNMTPVVSGAFLQEAFNATSGQIVFSTLFPFTTGTTQVFVDGILQSMGATFDYLEGIQQVIFNDNSMAAGQRVVIAYQRSA